MGFSLAHTVPRSGLPATPAVVTTELSPARLDEQARNADVPRVIDNLDAGMGYSRRIEAVPNGYAYTLPGYCRAPGGIFGPAGSVSEIALPVPPAWEPAGITQSVSFRGDIHLLTQGRHQLMLPGGAGPAVVAVDGGAGFSGQGMAVFNNRLYVAGSGGGLLYRDGVTGAWNGPFPVVRGRLATATWRPQGVPTEVLIGVAPDSTVRWCPITADPTVDANWSAPVTVGADRAYTINALVAAPRRVFILRPDGVYDIDELGTRAYNIAPWIANGRDHSNGFWGLHVGQGLYYAHSQGVAYIPTSGEAQYEPSWVQPGWGLPFEGPVIGHPIAGALYNGWRYVAVYNGYESFICAGIPSDQAYGLTTHIWHGAEAVLPGHVTHMEADTVSTAGGWPRMLLATLEGDEVTLIPRLWQQSLPKWGTPIQELLLGGGFAPAYLSSLFLPADPWERPSSVKTMLQFDLVTERLTDANIVTLYAGADEGGYVEQGTTEAGSTYTSFAPLELTEGRYIKTRVDLVGSPILRSLELRAAVGIDLREARVYRVVLGSDTALQTPRGRETRDPEQRLLDLRTMVGRVVTLEDQYPMRVRVLQVLAPERRQLATGARAGAWMIVVPLLVSILDHPARFDGADRYGTDRTWG